MSFTTDTVQKVWEKGTVVSNNDPKHWRQDQRGAWIARNQYGNRNSQYGWEIDHIKPESKGGVNGLSNLRPLQWENNVGKQGGRLPCPIIASGAENVRR
jgi:hypothetical protein